MQVLDRIARVIVAVLAPLSALTLFAILLLMVADVGARFAFNRPIRGAFEVTEFLMCVLILGALPLVGLWRRHVEASLIADAVPRLAPLLQWLAGVLSVILFGYLAMLMWNYAGQLALRRSHSLFGGIPHAPFAYFMAVLFLVSAVASAIAILRHDPGPQPEERDP